MRLPRSARSCSPSVSACSAHARRAQQRPLTTEDPEVIGAGRVLVEAGVESGQNARYFLSGLKGDRVADARGHQRRARQHRRTAAGCRLHVVRHRQPHRCAAGVSRARRRHAHLRCHRPDRRDEDSRLGEGPPRPALASASRRACRTRATKAASASTRRTSSSASWAGRPSARGASPATPASAF